jgi:AcrR family transcriptional regulator
MATTKRRTRTRHYHHGDLRRALIDGALSLIECEGISALSLREVARRIGVSHAAPHHHFANRTLLLCAIAEEGFIALHAAMVDAVRSFSPQAPEQLRALGVAYVRFAVTHPRYFRVMFSPEVTGERATAALRQASGSTYSLLTARLCAVGLSESAASDAALLAWSTVHGLAMLWLDRQLTFPGLASSAEDLAQKVLGILMSTRIDA